MKIQLYVCYSGRLDDGNKLQKKKKKYSNMCNINYVCLKSKYLKIKKKDMYGKMNDTVFYMQKMSIVT